MDVRHRGPGKALCGAGAVGERLLGADEVRHAHGEGLHGDVLAAVGVVAELVDGVEDVRGGGCFARRARHVAVPHGPEVLRDGVPGVALDDEGLTRVVGGDGDVVAGAGRGAVAVAGDDRLGKGAVVDGGLVLVYAAGEELACLQGLCRGAGVDLRIQNALHGYSAVSFC